MLRISYTQKYHHIISLEQKKRTIQKLQANATRYKKLLLIKHSIKPYHKVSFLFTTYDIKTWKFLCCLIIDYNCALVLLLFATSLILLGFFSFTAQRTVLLKTKTKSLMLCTCTYELIDLKPRAIQVYFITTPTTPPT